MDKKKARILVTGGTGLIGRYVVESLLSQGYQHIEIFSRGHYQNKEISKGAKVTHTVGNILELFPLEDAIARSTHVIHCAALVSYDPGDNEKMARINVEGTANVVNICLDHNIQKLIYISSIAAIGKDDRATVITEDLPWITDDDNSFYSITKHKAEQEAWRGYYEGLPTAIVNPAVVIGDGDWGKSSLQLFERVRKGLPYYPKGGTGIVDVRDVADFIIRLLESDIEGERYILSGANVTYQHLFNMIAKAIGVKPPMKAAPDWMLSFLWRFEKLRTIVFKTSPLITKSSVVSTSKMIKFDNSKSLSIQGFSYRPEAETIKHYGAAFVNDEEQ